MTSSTTKHAEIFKIFRLFLSPTVANAIQMKEDRLEHLRKFFFSVFSIATQIIEAILL